MFIKDRSKTDMIYHKVNIWKFNYQNKFEICKQCHNRNNSCTKTFLSIHLNNHINKGIQMRIYTQLLESFKLQIRLFNLNYSQMLN